MLGGDFSRLDQTLARGGEAGAPAVPKKSRHSAFRPSSVAAAVILPDAAESSLKTSSALRNAVAAISLSPRTTRERIRRVQPSTSRGELSRRSARRSTIDRMTSLCSLLGGVAVCKGEAVSELSLAEAFALACSYESLSSAEFGSSSSALA